MNKSPNLHSYSGTNDWKKPLRNFYKTLSCFCLMSTQTLWKYFQQKSILTSYFLDRRRLCLFWHNGIVSEPCFNLCEFWHAWRDSSSISISLAVLSHFSLSSAFFFPFPPHSHGPWTTSAVSSALQSLMLRLEAFYLCWNCKLKKL